MVFSFSSFDFALIAISSILIIVGLLCLIIEIQIPGFGVFGITGVVLTLAGFLLLIGSVEMKLPHLEIYVKTTLPLILLVILTTFVVLKIYETTKIKPATGLFEGKKAFAIDDIKKGEDGFVIFNGEYWKAESEDEIKKDDKVEIIRKEREKLIVKKLND